jgi:alpha-beta hydrolase superfamily lysophospholipase
MKNRILVTLISLYSVSFAQNDEILGKWYGELNIMETTLRFNIGIDVEQEKLNATLASPDQKAYGIKTDSVSFINDTLYFKSNAMKAFYKGILKDEKITGVFNQVMEIDLVFQRDSILKKEVKRPQEPKPPYNYYTEDITVKNKKAKIELAGTLTLPGKTGKFPVVILVTGSGPQNRDSELLGHKPFLVWADYLAKNGIGSFRYDDRGVAKSTGKHADSDLNDFYSDLKSVVKTINKRKEVESLGVIGHSVGGLLSPWLASKCKKIDFVIMLAGPGAFTKELMAEQRKIISTQMGESDEDILFNNNLFEKIDEVVLNNKNKTTLTDSLTRLITHTLDSSKNPDHKKLSVRMLIAQQTIPFVTSSWYKSFIAINPATYLTKIKQPVFALNGDKDCQVASYQNIPVIDKALKEGKCKNYKTKVYPNLNHLFQKCETGSLSEYGSIEETVNPEVLNDVSNWINSLSK